MAIKNRNDHVRNRLLAAMAQEDFDRLKPHFETVSLAPRQVLLESGHAVSRAYFLHGGFVSYLVVFEDGLAIETATIGAEGVVGLPLPGPQEISQTQAVVQAPGMATVIPTAVLKSAINESATLRALFGNYICAFIAQIQQSVACNAVHSTKERMARWLLTSADHTDGKSVSLTHEFLAEMLGVGRPTVSLIARTLQRQGLIRCHRAHVDIVNRQRLEQVCCPCYRVIRRAYDSLLPRPRKSP